MLELVAAPARPPLLTCVGADLIAQGYFVIPIKVNDKAPAVPEWQKARADRKMLAGWVSQCPERGAGVLTFNTPAIDIDVQDSALAEKLVHWVYERFPYAPTRVGKAPKTLLVFRSETPFRKISSKTYVAADGRRHKVEILGDGQQFVAYGRHPETHQPYKWLQCQLTETHHDDLPVLTEEIARDFVAYFESIVPADWRVVGQGVGGGANRDPDNALIGFTPPLANLSTAEIVASLKNIDANPYDIWINIGMALHHQYGGGAEGLGLWDRWSQRGDTYRAGEIPAKWRGFADVAPGREPITAAYILKLGRPRAELPDAVERYIYVKEGDQVADTMLPPQHCLSPFAVFKNATANERVEVPAPTANDPDRTRWDPVWKVWIVNAARRTAQGSAYDPEAGRLITDEDGLLWINTFHMAGHRATTGEDRLSTFFEHMAYLIPSEDERRWFIGWMAFTIQRPAVRCKVTPLHVARAHGTGRGWIVELMQELLGAWNCATTKMETLAGEGKGGGYTEYLRRTLFCSIGEVKEGGKRFQVADRIRDVLTEPSLEMNLKFGSKGTERVYTNFFLMTNHRDALVLPPEDRRIMVIEGPDDPKDRTYYDRLYAWLGDKEAVAQLFHWLMRYDLSGFDWQRAAHTPARERMIECGQSETERLFREMLEDPPEIALTFAQIRARLSADVEDGFFGVDEGQLRKLLQMHCGQLPKKQVKIAGVRERPWVFECASIPSEKDVVAAILRERARGNG